MTFKPAIWYPIAVVLCVVNVGAVWFAAAPGQALHATAHAALAVGFGLWAQRLRRPSGRQEFRDGLQDGLEAVEFDVSAMRQELNETQERLDFAERMLAQRPEQQRVERERQDPQPPR